MIKGYKYDIGGLRNTYKFVSVDQDAAGFGKTMLYDLAPVLHTKRDFFEHFDVEWLYELHDIYLQTVDRDRLTVGIGSGYGEHEFLLRLRGYNVVASDIVPGLSNVFKNIDSEFRHIYLDILRDDIRESLRINSIFAEDFDVLVSGLIFYFDDAVATEIFSRIYRALNPGSNFVFTLRYRDYLFAPVLEGILRLEMLMLARMKKRGIICKHHGYRRSVKDVRNMAERVGFRTDGIYPTMYGYEATRSRILSKIGLAKLFGLSDRIIPLFYSGIVFKFSRQASTGQMIPSASV